MLILDSFGEPQTPYFDVTQQSANEYISGRPCQRLVGKEGLGLEDLGHCCVELEQRG